MKDRNVLGWLLGMIVLGSLGLSFVGWLVAYRTGQPLTTETALQEQAAAEPGRALVQGASTAAELAADYLANGERRHGVHAMDAAMRAAELGQNVFSGAAGQRFDQGLKRIMEGRHALQMGHQRQAVDSLSKAAGILKGTGLSPIVGNVAGAGYEGATVMNAQGVRIGEVEAVDDAGETVVVRLGGMQDFLGFLDLGGVALSVDAKRMLFGKSRTIGPTMVGLPTYATKPADIRTSLAPR